MFQTVTPTELCSPKDVFRLRLNIAKQYRDGSGEDQSLFLLLAPKSGALIGLSVQNQSMFYENGLKLMKGDENL